MKRKMPAHLADLVSAGYDLETYRIVCEWFKTRGVQVSYIHAKRVWCFFAIGVPEGSTCVRCLVGVEAFIDMLDAPFSTIKAIKAHGGKVP